MKQLIPSYDSKKEWHMDPKGYFIIKVFYEKQQIGLRHYPAVNEEPDMEMFGDDSYAILQTLVREGYVTTTQHAGYLGHELHKAETAMREKIEYIQDKPLDHAQPFTKDPSENISG